MTIELKSYRSRLMEKLTIPSEAVHYINAALEDSTEMFLEAIKDVAQAHEMATVAKKSGVAREALYRSFSKRGNPTWDTMLSVFSVLGLESAGVRERTSAVGNKTISRPASARKKIAHLSAKHRTGVSPHQLAFNFDNPILGGATRLISRYTPTTAREIKLTTFPSGNSIAASGPEQNQGPYEASGVENTWFPQSVSAGAILAEA